MVQLHDSTLASLGFLSSHTPRQQDARDVPDTIAVSMDSVVDSIGESDNRVRIVSQLLSSTKQTQLPSPINRDTTLQGNCSSMNMLNPSSRRSEGQVSCDYGAEVNHETLVDGMARKLVH